MTKNLFALVSVRDRSCRWRVAESLRRLGWTVIEYASGFHLVRALSEVILGNRALARPGLIVVDAISPGCSGVTVAAGFRDLGLDIPIILIVPGERPAPSVVVVEPAAASPALVALAKLPLEPLIVDGGFHVG